MSTYRGFPGSRPDATGRDRTRSARAGHPVPLKSGVSVRLLALIAVAWTLRLQGQRPSRNYLEN
jgi:hypothetical protein